VKGLIPLIPFSSVEKGKGLFFERGFTPLRLPVFDDLSDDCWLSADHSWHSCPWL